jgi:nicotinamide mononucleotide transporter
VTPFSLLCDWLVAHGSSCLELVAVLFGIAGVWLSIYERISNWPVGIINVALYAVLFVQQKLYANAGLQLVYLALSIYGWHQWLYGGARKEALVVRRTGRDLAVRLVGATVLIWAGLIAFTQLAGGAMPLVDSGTTAVSLVAEWMLARKLVENWAVWIGVDAVYVAMLLSGHLYLTAVNYAIYFGLAVVGYVAWRRLAVVQPT